MAKRSAELLPDPQREPTISVERTARIYGISRASAYKAAQTGQIPTLRVGRRLLVPTARLLQMLGINAKGDGDRAA